MVSCEVSKKEKKKKRKKNIKYKKVSVSGIQGIGSITKDILVRVIKKIISIQNG